MANWNYVVGADSFNYLTEEQKQENALIIADILRPLGWSDAAIAGMLGSVSIEGIFNPGQGEVGYGLPSSVYDTSYAGGLGLIQWTKPSGGNINPLLKYAQAKNRDWWDGDLQTEYLNHCDDPDYTYYLWGWSTTPSTAIDISFQDFKHLTQPAYCASIWFRNVERPSDPTASESLRQQYATQWYNYITTHSNYVPRLDYTGTDTLPYYTTYNPYWTWTIEDGQRVWLGMNNCTAYAYGRWNELAQATSLNYNYPIGDGANWVRDGIAMGYDHGNVPRLGAAISWKKPSVNSNHVAIVEEIQYDANGNPVSFTISQSAFNNNQPAPNTGSRGPDQAGYNYFPWFWTDTVYMNNLDFVYGSGSFQGFLYHPNITPSPIPPTPKKRKIPFFFYLKQPL